MWCLCFTVQSWCAASCHRCCSSMGHLVVLMAVTGNPLLWDAYLPSLYRFSGTVFQSFNLIALKHSCGDGCVGRSPRSKFLSDSRGRLRVWWKMPVGGIKVDLGTGEIADGLIKQFCSLFSATVNCQRLTPRLRLCPLTGRSSVHLWTPHCIYAEGSLVSTLSGALDIPIVSFCLPSWGSHSGSHTFFSKFFILILSLHPPIFSGLFSSSEFTPPFHYNTSNFTLLNMFARNASSSGSFINLPRMSFN